MNKPFAPLLVALPLLLAGCGHHAKEPQRVDTRTRTAPAVLGGGRLVDVGGRRLYMNCTGSGSPTVILEAGFGGSSDNWRDVQPELARTARTCSYDRAGLGSSVGRPGAHDASDEIHDLKQLLFAARIPPPYVLVGHSYGGLLTRLYAHDYPGDVAGLVQVDAVGRDGTPRVLARWPKSLDPEVRSSFAQPVTNDVDVRAGEQLDSRIRSLGHLPLVVIEAGRHQEVFGGFSGRVLAAEERLWDTMQHEIAQLSTDSLLVVARRSDHFVQRLDGQPGVVARGVGEVVRAVREGARLEPCARVFRGQAVRCVRG